MPISSTTRKVGPLPGNGVATDFAFPFKVFETSDVRVLRTSPTGGDVVLALGSAYSVILNPDQDEDPGGIVRLNEALPAGYSLTLVSNVPLTQPVDWQSQGRFSPEAMNDAFDRTVAGSQQLAEQLSRTLVLPATVDPITAEKPMPGSLLAWNSDGTRLISVDPSTVAGFAAYGTGRVDVFTGDGVETDFTLSVNPGAEENLFVAIGGVVQAPDLDYTWAGGTTLTFAEPPPADTRIVVRYQQALAEIGGGGGGGGGVTSVNGRTGIVLLSKTDVGLPLADNTRDINKPVSGPQQAALDLKLNLSAVGQPNGVASLGADGKVPSSQLPAGGGGSGDVTGPSSSVNDRIALFDGTTGKVIKQAGVGVSALMLASNNLSDVASASTARTNLGATSLGSSLFTSASAAAARAALGVVIGTDVAAYNDPRFNALSLTITPDVSAGNTAAANTSAIQAALDTAAGSSGPVRVVLPAGTFSVNPLTINGNNISLEGQGQFNRGTNLVFANATGVSLTVSGQYNVVSGLYLTSSVRRTSGLYIQTTNTFECLVERVRWDYGWNGIRVGPSATETRVKDCSARYMLGENPGVWFRGSGLGAGGCYRLTIDNFRCDNPYPVAYSTYKARTNGTTFTAGQMSLFNSGIWVCATGGTTGTTAPSAVPGTGPADWIEANVTDGSVVWRYVANGSACWVDQDSYAYSLVIDKSALINGAFGFRMRDSANTGDSYPIWAFCWDVETDHPITAGVLLSGGEGFFANGSWFGSTLNGNGAVVDATFRGEAFIGGGTRIYGNAQHGVLLQAGPGEVTITGCFIGANSTSSIGSFHGIAVANGASGFTISNNVSGLNAQNVVNYQGRGVSVGNGCSGFNVFGNDLRGNVNAEGLSIGTSPSAYNAFANIGSTISTITASASSEIPSGNGSPEGAVSAAPGTLYRQLDGANGYTLWYKRTAGAGSAGWSTVAGSHTTAVLQPQQGILFPLGQGVSTTYSGLGRNLIRHQSADNGVMIGDVNERSPYVAITANLVPDVGGNLLLGTSTQRFQGGNLVNAMNVSSDLRLKRDVAEIDTGAVLATVPAVGFNWREGDTERHYGWIAQDVRAATEAAGLPDIVKEGEDGMLSLDPTAMCAILWNEVRELRKRVAELEANS